MELPAVIVGAIATHNRFVEFYVKPFVKDLKPNGQPLSDKMYGLVMSIISLIVGIFIYMTTAGVADAFLDLPLLTQFQMPYLLELFLGGLLLWLGADFARLIYGMVDYYNDARRILKGLVPVRDDDTVVVQVSEPASSQVVKRGGKG